MLPTDSSLPLRETTYTPLRRAERLASKEKGDLGAVDRAWWSWWPWSRKRLSTSQYINIDPCGPVEQKKLVFSTDLFTLLTWHIWTVISCVVSVVLLYLNFSEYQIGTEIGRTQQGTRNILGTLQLAAKAHEIIMIVSLGNIVRQWIQKCLVDDGLLLGLVGSESSLSNLALLVSPEFRAGISCSVAMLCDRGGGQYQRRRQGRALAILLGSLSFGCLLCSLAGPASAVLMIPRYDWFHKSVISKALDSSRESFLQSFMEKFEPERTSVHYPNIFIAPELDTGGTSRRGSMFLMWSNYWRNALHNRKPSTHSSHFYLDKFVLWETRIDVATSLSRMLAVDAHWQGATLLTGVMESDFASAIGLVTDIEAIPDDQNPHIKFSAELTGVEVKSVCRRRPKQRCPYATGETLEWCYDSVTDSSLNGQLQSSKHLLLVYDSSNKASKRVWMTEGPTSLYKEFSDSIVILFEEVLGDRFKDPSLIVCSAFAAFKSVTTSSIIELHTPEHFDVHEYIAHFNGTTTTERKPRIVQYHKSWLESIHGSSNASDACRYIVNTTYPCRGQMRITGNQYLLDWARMIRMAGGFNSRDTWWQADMPIEASAIETIVGGSIISNLLRIRSSRSQYPQNTSEGSLSFPEDLIIESVENYTQYVRPPITVYHLVYGFRIWSRTSMLSVIVLITHTALILGGSLWQLSRGTLIQAWGSIPQYVMLCLGSEPARASGGVENTCAGIDCYETLNRVVRIREVTDEHLELVVVAPDTELLGSVVDPEKRYGFLGERRRRTKEKLE